MKFKKGDKVKVVSTRFSEQHGLVGMVYDTFEGGLSGFSTRVRCLLEDNRDHVLLSVRHPVYNNTYADRDLESVGGPW